MDVVVPLVVIGVVRQGDQERFATEHDFGVGGTGVGLDHQVEPEIEVLPACESPTGRGHLRDLGGGVAADSGSRLRGRQALSRFPAARGGQVDTVHLVEREFDPIDWVTSGSRLFLAVRRRPRVLGLDTLVQRQSCLLCRIDVGAVSVRRSGEPQQADGQSRSQRQQSPAGFLPSGHVIPSICFVECPSTVSRVISFGSRDHQRSFR